MIQTATAEVAEAIETIGDTIRNLHGISVAVAASVEQQGLATGDIALTVDQVARSTTTTTDAAEQAQASSKRGRAYAVKVGEVASKLSSESQLLSSEVIDFLNSLKNISDVNQFRTLNVDLGCQVVDGTRNTTGRIIRVSSGAILFPGQLDTSLGTRVEIRIDGVSRKIHARCAGPAEGGYFFQLPMNSAHLSYMEELLATLEGVAA